MFVVCEINDRKDLCKDNIALYALVMSCIEHLWAEGKIVLKEESPV